MPDRWIVVIDDKDPRTRVYACGRHTEFDPWTTSPSRAHVWPTEEGARLWVKSRSASRHGSGNIGIYTIRQPRKAGQR